MTLRALIDSPSCPFHDLDNELTVSNLLDFDIEVFVGLNPKYIVGSCCYDVEDCSGDVVTKLQLFL